VLIDIVRRLSWGPEEGRDIQTLVINQSLLDYYLLQARSTGRAPIVVKEEEEEESKGSSGSGSGSDTDGSSSIEDSDRPPKEG